MFIEDRNYDYFMELTKKFLSPYLEFYAYCLLPNHFHFLVRVKPENHCDALDKKISNQFRSFFIAYTNAVNKAYGLHGGLFATPFRRIQLDSDEYLSSVICYIHGNPVHHGITTTPDAYKYSSYLSIINGRDIIVNNNGVLTWFGNVDEYMKAHCTKISDLQNLPFYLE